MNDVFEAEKLRIPLLHTNAYSVVHSIKQSPVKVVSLVLIPVATLGLKVAE